MRRRPPAQKAARALVPLLVALVLLGSACSTFGTAPAATIDGTEISASSVTDEVKTIRDNDAYRQVLEQSYGAPTLGGGKGTFNAAFVAQVLSLRVWYAAIENDVKSRGLEVTPELLQGAQSDLEQQFQQLGPTVFASFPKAYRDRLVRQRALISLVDDDISKDIGTDERAFYNANKDEFAEICLSHALVGVQDGTAPEVAQAEAQKLYEAIKSGKTTFEDVATDKSDDTSAAQSAGSLGCGSKLTLQFDPTFETAAFALKKGVVSEPVQTQFGSHLILVTSRTIPSYDEVAAQVQTVMQQAHDERVNAYLTRVICGGDVDVNPRYGTWTAEVCDGLAPQLPQIRPPEAPAGSTTTTPAPQG
jgi:parvulin-like peptidyl-prolyl isomerase